MHKYTLFRTQFWFDIINFKLFACFVLCLAACITANFAFAAPNTSSSIIKPKFIDSKIAERLKEEQLKVQDSAAKTHVSVLDDSLIVTAPLKGWYSTSFGSNKINEQTFAEAFVPNTYKWNNAPVVMYVQSVKKSNINLDEFIRQDLSGLQEATSASLESFKINGKEYVLKQITPVKHDPYIIAYVAQENHFLLYVLSGKHVNLLKDYVKDLQNLIKNTTYAYFVRNEVKDDKPVYVYCNENKEEIKFVTEKTE